jgi:hypothetical protein
VQAVKGRDVPTGLSIDEATERAKATLRRIAEDGDGTPWTESGSDLADVIHAACRVVASEEVLPAMGMNALTTLYSTVEGLCWPDDHFDERGELLARVSYLAWLCARRHGTCTETIRWEARAIEHARRQEPVRAFMDLCLEERSDDLNRRFLGDPAVLLAVIGRLRELMDHQPVLLLREATGMREWLVANQGVLPSREEAAYFVAEFDWILAAGSRLRGRYGVSQAWLVRMAQDFAGVVGSVSLRARGRYTQLTLLYHQRLFENVLEQLPEVVESFLGLGMQDYVSKCYLLKAISLKEVGREDEARAELAALTSDPGVRDKQVRALALIGLAELDGRLGRYGLAMAKLSAADALVRGECLPIVMGHLHGIRGEILRDQGSLLQAAESYRLAVVVYRAAGMVSFAVYVQVVLSETLLAAGLEGLATDEIMDALPTIAELHLVREAMAAVALLRESIRRRKPDPSALRELRSQLERMSKGGEL